MKNIVTKSALVAAGLAMLVMSVPASAFERTMKVDVPFSFLAGEQRLPAGMYLVRVDTTYHTMDLTAYGAGQSVRMRVKDSAIERKASSGSLGSLSFQKYGESLVLKGVFTPSSQTRLDLLTSRAEKELAKSQSPTSTQAATVDLQYR